MSGGRNREGAALHEPGSDRWTAVLMEKSRTHLTCDRQREWFWKRWTLKDTFTVSWFHKYTLTKVWEFWPILSSPSTHLQGLVVALIDPKLVSVCRQADHPLDAEGGGSGEGVLPRVSWNTGIIVDHCCRHSRAKHSRVNCIHISTLIYGYDQQNWDINSRGQNKLPLMGGWAGI